MEKHIDFVAQCEKNAIAKGILDKVKTLDLMYIEKCVIMEPIYRGWWRKATAENIVSRYVATMKIDKPLLNNIDDEMFDLISESLRHAVEGRMSVERDLFSMHCMEIAGLIEPLVYDLDIRYLMDPMPCNQTSFKWTMNFSFLVGTNPTTSAQAKRLQKEHKDNVVYCSLLVQYMHRP